MNYLIAVLVIRDANQRVSSDPPSVVEANHASSGYINDEDFCEPANRKKELHHCRDANHRQQLMNHKTCTGGRHAHELHGDSEQKNSHHQQQTLETA